METQHPEGGESPFIVKDDASIAAVLSLNAEDDGSVQYASCPVDGCGEAILITELDSHIEMHGEEEDQDTDQEIISGSREPEVKDGVKASFDTKLSHPLRNLDDRGKASSSGSPSEDPQASARAAWKNLLKMPEPTSKPVSAPTVKGARRRLGVKSPLHLAVPYHVMTNPSSSRKQSLVLTPTRIACHLGL
jgi:hypothetical protein